MSLPDAAIVGGGIIGCSIAWRLAQAGLAAEVYEAGRVGGEASWAGAGMLAPGGEVESESPWARRSVESLRMYPDFVRELEEESGRRIDYRACGAMEVAYEPEEEAADSNRSHAQASLGIPSRRMDAREALSAAPALSADGLIAAIHYSEDAIVDPRDVVAALRTAGERRGVRFREGCRVASVRDIASGAVVLAAGAWSSALLPGARESFPVKGCLVAYDLAPGTVGPILRRGHTYILQRGSGHTIAGSTTERAGYDRSVDPAVVRSIHRRAHQLLPSLLIASPHYSWIGFRPGVEGDEPQVGRFEDRRIWLAYGHYRNGILLAPVTARIIAQAITSE